MSHFPPAVVLLDSNPWRQQGSLSTTDPRDVYIFGINNTKNINLNLHDISVGDDVDLRLYSDSNGNRELDSNDQILSSSTNASNADDSINYLASEGIYFAVLDRYTLGSQGNADYHLDLSAGTFNLLPREINIGQLFRGGSGPQSFNNWVGSTDTLDTYAFSLPRVGSGSFHLVNIGLTGLTNDADIRIIQDFNNNRTVDPGEEIDSSANFGSSPESMTLGLDGGEYFVQVYQWRGNTNYQLTFS